MIKPSKTIKALAQALISSTELVTIVATRSTSIVDHSLGMVDDLAADGHHATSSHGAFNRLVRNQKLAKQYEESDFELPQELIALATA